jgi:hypothetical protein
MARTILDHIEIDQKTGSVFVELRKEGGPRDGPHRTVIEPGVAVADQVAAVNAHLARMGYPSADLDAIGQIEAEVATIAPLRATKAAERASALAAKTAEVMALKQARADEDAAKAAADEAAFRAIVAEELAKLP